MKKLIFSLAALLLVCAMAFSQKTNTEVYQTILRSKEINHTFFGINNPNLIFPGQILTFLYEDGTEVPVIVEKGDSQWIIVRDKLTKSQHQYGAVVDYPKTEPAAKQIVERVSVYPLWAKLLLAAIFLAFVIYVVYTLSKNPKVVDPVTAGDPQVEGGVSDAKAYDRMGELAGQRFPGATIEIKNIRGGRLSGPADIYYAGSTKSKKIYLRNISAYKGEIFVNGHSEIIYFLQGCGNDARVGNYMSGQEGLTFVSYVIVNEDGSVGVIPSQTPAAVIPVVKTETAVEVPKTDPITPVVTVPQGSEFFKNTTAALSIVEMFLKGNESQHKVTLKVTKDSIEAVIENNNRFDSKPQQKTPENNANEKK